MQLEDLLLEEYKSVRQESLEAAGRVQSVTQYLFAAGGVAITVGLVAADKDETVGAAVLMALIPLVVVLGMAMMTLEIQRVLGARRHLRRLETTINAQLEGSEPGLSWEATRLNPETRPLNPFPIVFVVAVAGIVVIGPGLGGLVLRDDLTVWYSVGAAADLIVAGVVVVVALRTYPRLRALETTDGTRSSGPLGGEGIRQRRLRAQCAWRPTRHRPRCCSEAQGIARSTVSVPQPRSDEHGWIRPR